MYREENVFEKKILENSPVQPLLLAWDSDLGGGVRALPQQVLKKGFTASTIINPLVPTATQKRDFSCVLRVRVGRG